MKFRMIPHYRGKIYAKASGSRLKRRRREALFAEIGRFAALAVLLPALVITLYQVLQEFGVDLEDTLNRSRLTGQIVIMAENAYAAFPHYADIGLPAILIALVAIHLIANAIVDLAMYD